MSIRKEDLLAVDNKANMRAGPVSGKDIFNFVLGVLLICAFGGVVYLVPTSALGRYRSCKHVLSFSCLFTGLALISFSVICIRKHAGDKQWARWAIIRNHRVLVSAIVGGFASIMGHTSILFWVFVIRLNVGGSRENAPAFRSRVIGASFILFFGVFFVYAYVKDRRYAESLRLSPLCENCGYSLIGSESAVCPECGHPVGPR